MHDGVDPRRRQQARERGAADVGLDELGGGQIVGRLARVDPGYVGDGRVAFQTAGQLGAPMTGDPGDQNPAAGVHLTLSFRLSLGPGA